MPSSAVSKTRDIEPMQLKSSGGDNSDCEIPFSACGTLNSNLCHSRIQHCILKSMHMPSSNLLGSATVHAVSKGPELLLPELDVVAASSFGVFHGIHCQVVYFSSSMAKEYGYAHNDTQSTYGTMISE